MAQKALYDLAVSPTALNFLSCVPAGTSNILSNLPQSFCAVSFCLESSSPKFLHGWILSFIQVSAQKSLPQRSFCEIVYQKDSPSILPIILHSFILLYFSQNILLCEIIRYIICLYIYWMSLHLDYNQCEGKGFVLFTMTTLVLSIQQIPKTPVG